MSQSGKIGLVNINLEMPEDIAFQEPISFAWEQKNYFEDRYEDIFVGVAGSAQFSHNFQSTSESDASKMYPSFLLLIIILTYILLRSVVASIISLIVIMLSILPSLGAAGWLGFEVQPPLITAPIIILTISLTHAIHMLSIGLTNMTEGMTKNDAIIESLKINFVPIFLTSFTTAAGIAGINFGDIPAYSEMANTVVIGGVFGFILTLLVFSIPLPIFIGADLITLSVSGLLGILIGDLLFLESLRRLGSSLVAVVGTIYVPSILILSYCMFGELITMQSYIGAILVIIGITFSFYKSP